MLAGKKPKLRKNKQSFPALIAAEFIVASDPDCAVPEISIPTPWKVIPEIPRGLEVSKAQILKAKV